MKKHSKKNKMIIPFRILIFLSLRKQKRLDIEQAKIQERMDMYARQDQLRAERKS